MARPQSVSDDEILDAAERVLDEMGHDRFSISEVARQLGLSRAAITFRFEGPDALRRLALARKVARMERHIDGWTIEPGAAGLLEIAGRIGVMAGGRAGFARSMLRFSDNLDDPVAREVELHRGDIVRAAIAKAMPDTAVARTEAIDAFMAHVTGSLVAWQASTGIDAETFLRQRTLVWLRLTGIDAKVDHAGAAR